MTSRQWTALVTVAGLLILLSAILPLVFHFTGTSDEFTSAVGTWVAAGIVAAVGLLAIPQLATTKRSVDADVFLKVCEQIDDEEFGRRYDLCRREGARFQNVTISKDNRLRLWPDDPALREAAMDVLYTLEEVGVIFHHSALNKEMIAEYVGDVVVNAYAVLLPVIHVFQERDQEMFERVVELRNYCIDNGWKEDVAAALPFTRL